MWSANVLPSTSTISEPRLDASTNGTMVWSAIAPVRCRSARSNHSWLRGPGSSVTTFGSSKATVVAVGGAGSWGLLRWTGSPP